MGLVHASLIDLRTQAAVEVLFNPEEYTVKKDNRYAEAAVPGLSSPLLQFVNGSLATLTMSLFFDTLEEHRHGGRLVPGKSDVRAFTGQVAGFLDIDPETHAPPPLQFVWGELVFTCVLTSVTQRFTMFLDSGIPVRAQLDVAFSEYVNELAEPRAVKRETADYTRVHTVGEGESLSAIAHRLYADPRKWRAIAIANDLTSLRRLPVGAVLTVPALPYRDPATGTVHA